MSIKPSAAAWPRLVMLIWKVASGADRNLVGAADADIYRRGRDRGGRAIAGVQAAGRRHFRTTGRAARLHRPQRQLDRLPLAGAEMPQPPLEPFSGHLGGRIAAQIGKPVRRLLR